MIKINDYVIKIGDYYKNKIQSPLKIIKIIDHKPVDGQIEEKVIAILEDRTWEFIWNLKKIV